MADKNYTFEDILHAYNNKANIMKLLKEGDKNSLLAIQLSYDLQSGSYIKAMSDPQYMKIKDTEIQKFAEHLEPYLSCGDTLLEAGTGEATTLTGLLNKWPDLKLNVRAFDISWSRLHYARMWLKNNGLDADLFMATLTAIPLPDNSVDIVFTSHSIEPNHGNEEIILAELYRVARKAVIMFEPAYELANEQARARMEDLGYCRGLPDIVRQNGWALAEHKMLSNINNNPTAVTVVKKESGRGEEGFACPLCRGKLLKYEGNLFCGNDGVVFPIIRGIPSLLPESAIIASKYIDEWYE